MAKAARKWNPSLHPRDARGRFTRSSTRVMKGTDTSRARSAVTGFRPAKITDEAGARAWVDRNAGARPAPDSAMGQYLAGGWKQTNPAIRQQKTPPPGVEEIDAEFGPLPEDVVLRRQVPLAMFAHIPVDDLVGMKVRDAAYASTSLDRPDTGPSAPDAVTMHIAAAAGTPAYVNAPDGEILLARDTEVAITRAEPNGRGGWDVYGAVIPKTTVKRDAAARDDQGDGDGTGAPAPADAGPADAPDTDGDTTGRGSAGTPPAEPANEPAEDEPAAPDAGQQTGDGTPATGTSTPDDGDATPAADDADAGPWIAPATGALAALDPIDRERVRIAVEDNAGRIFRTPFMGGTPGNVARYVAEGRDLQDVSARYKLQPTVNAVAQILADRPDLMDRTDDEVTVAAAARDADAMARAEAASVAAGRGDFAVARAEMDRGEAIKPDFFVALGGPALTWSDIRKIIDEMEEENGGGNQETGDATPAAGTAMPGGMPISDTATLAAAVAATPDGERVGRSIGAYRNAAYNPVNRALRDARGGQVDNERAAAVIADIDALMAQSETSEPAVLYRGVGDAEAAFGEAWTSGQPMDGSEWTDHGYISTSVSRDTAERFGGDDLGVVVRYNVPAGVPAIGLRDDVNQSEWEVLLGRGLRYRITGDRVENGQRVLDADILPPDDSTPETPAAPQAVADRKPVTYPQLWHIAPPASVDAIRDGGFRAGQGRGPDGQGGGGAFFGSGVYLFTDQAAADRYLDGVNAYQYSNPQQLTAQARVANPFVVNATAADVDPGGLMRRHLVAAGLAQPGERLSPQEITNRLQQAGYDGVEVHQAEANDDIGGSQLLVFDPVDVELTGGAPAAGTSAPSGPDNGPDSDDGTDNGNGIGGTPTPTGPDTGPAGPAQQLDIMGDSTDFVPASLSTLGLPERRVDVGRERAIAAVQQLGLFADERQAPGFEGQMAMMDALLNVPGGDAAAPPPAPRIPAPAAPAAPTAPASVVPEDLSGWNDEQLAELFRTVTGVHDPADVDEDGAYRIAGEWERREAAMADLVASVPDDLTGLPEDEVAGLYARLTSETGTMDHPTVARLGAELDRRQEEERLAAENAPKRALLARPVGELTDDEIGTAAGYAVDLGDVEALERIAVEGDRRDREREAAAQRAQLEREAREAAEREAALQAAQDAERRAAAEHAEAQRDRLIDAMAAAQAAAIVPEFDGPATGLAGAVLGETRLRELLGGDTVDRWVDGIEEGRDDARRIAIQAGVKALPARDRVRLVMAASQQDAAAEFRDWSDGQLKPLITQGLFASSTDPEAAQKRARGQRAGLEVTRRKIVTLREDTVRDFRQWQIRAMAADPGKLTDAELEVAPGLVTDTGGMLGDDVTGRLDALRAETMRRQAEAGQVAEQKAAGPAAPARYRNPVQQYGWLRSMLERPQTQRERDTRDRLRRAQAAVYGLPEDADDRAVRAAERKDPRPVADQAAAIMAWHRHLAQYEDLGDNPSQYAQGFPDDADVPDTPDPLPPANVSKPDEVWEQILGVARQEFTDGQYDTARRALRAIARTYRIPADDVEASQDGLRRVQEETSPAIRHDRRTEKQRAADFIAQYRALAAEDGVDPSDTLRYGPPDKGTRRTSRTAVRTSTPEQEQRINALVARGWDWLDAYAEVHGVDVADVQGRAAGGRSGMTEKQIRESYAQWVELQFLAAEAATSGYLVKRSSVAKIEDARALFSGSWTAARAHASEELLQWWAANPRLTYADFKAQIVGGEAARDSRARLVAAGKGNEFA